MGDNSNERDPLLDVFIFETSQLLEQLESIMLEVEKEGQISEEHMNEIFRIMHTIKGSAAMMMYDNISAAAHRIEDLFFKIRENKSTGDQFSEVCDIVFDGADFIREQMGKIEAGEEASDTNDNLIENIEQVLAIMNGEEVGQVKHQKVKNQEVRSEEVLESAPQKAAIKKGANKYIAKVYFEDDCKMENVRAFSLINELEKHSTELFSKPAELFADENSSSVIASEGLDLYFCTDMLKGEVESLIKNQLCIKEIKVEKVKDYSSLIGHTLAEKSVKTEGKGTPTKSVQAKPGLINVNVDKLDLLMDLVGEIVISSSMVVNSPDLKGLDLKYFHKSAEHLGKLTRGIQDVVMSMRMVPVAAVFQRMNRIVRDMSKNLNKDVELVIVGEETEVDKTIIDNISDPIMHLVRNCMDHGIETHEERAETSKPEKGKITLSAVNTGSNVVVTVSDDGRGLDKGKILKKAIEKNLIPESSLEISDRKAYSLILMPGFSTKETVTEYSGRGVGMDVVKQNIESIGGSVEVDSKLGEGTSMIITIPLTLAIIDGMSVQVGNSVFIIPISSVIESFKGKMKDIVKDPCGNEMIIIRGECYDIIRLHELYDIDTKVTDFEEGIFVTIKGADRYTCLFVDNILGEQQIVIKPLPAYISNSIESYSGISGCTILADGNVGFILNAIEF